MISKSKLFSWIVGGSPAILLTRCSSASCGERSGRCGEPPATSAESWNEIHERKSHLDRKHFFEFQILSWQTFWHKFNCRGGDRRLRWVGICFVGPGLRWWARVEMAPHGARKRVVIVWDLLVMAVRTATWMKIMFSELTPNILDFSGFVSALEFTNFDVDGDGKQSVK